MSDGGDTDCEVLVYRRPVLRAIVGAFLVGFDVLTVYFCSRFVSGVEKIDVASTWWLPLFTGPLLSLGYLYVASDLVADDSHIHIRNPFREIVLSWTDVQDVRMESNLCVVTPHGTYFAWGVESADIAPLKRRAVRVGELSGPIRTDEPVEASQKAKSGYRFRAPGVMFTVSITCCVVCSLVILVRG